jgi:RNA polymerase sigma-70 factor (ECF subfamily)
LTDSKSPSQSLDVGSAAAMRVEQEASPPIDFKAVYEANFDYVFHTLRRMGAPDRDLEDLIHDVFLAFYRGLDGFDPTRPVKPWLFGIAFRVFSDFRRKAQHKYEIPSEPRDRASNQPPADELVAQRQRHDLVLRALDVLDLDKRAVLVMHDIDGHAMPEIAAVLSVPLNTAYSRLRLAREQFAAAVRRLRAGAEEGP